MKKLIAFVVFFASLQLFAAPTSTNQAEMDEIQQELMNEIDTVTIDGNDEEFLDQEIEKIPDLEPKLEMISQKEKKNTKPVKTSKAGVSQKIQKK